MWNLQKMVRGAIAAGARVLQARYVVFVLVLCSRFLGIWQFKTTCLRAPMQTLSGKMPVTRTL